MNKIDARKIALVQIKQIKGKSVSELKHNRVECRDYQFQQLSDLRQKYQQDSQNLCRIHNIETYRNEGLIEAAKRR